MACHWSFGPLKHVLSQLLKHCYPCIQLLLILFKEYMRETLEYWKITETILLLTFIDVKGNLLWLIGPILFPLVIPVLISDSVYSIEGSQLYPQLLPTDTAPVALICKAVDLAHVLCGPIPDTWRLDFNPTGIQNGYNFNCGNYLCRDITLKFDYSCFDKCNTL